MIKFIVDSAEYEVNNPTIGYTSTIKPALVHQALMPRGYSIWDNSYLRDQRICKAIFLMSNTLTTILVNLFTDSDKGRGLDIELDLGATPTGFFPFGPDFGDKGIFNVRMINIIVGGSKEAPYLNFETEVTLGMVTKPVYTLPTEVPEGVNFSIGTITDLRYPPDFPLPDSNYLMNTNVMRNGTVYYTVDKLENQYFTKLPMLCNQSKAAALLKHLTETVRGNDVTLLGDANFYLFGPDVIGSGQYKTKWMNEVVEITHINYDLFQFDLTFFLENVI